MTYIASCTIDKITRIKVINYRKDKSNVNENIMVGSKIILN